MGGHVGCARPLPHEYNWKWWTPSRTQLGWRQRRQPGGVMLVPGGSLGCFSCHSIRGRLKHPSYRLLGWILPKQMKLPRRCVRHLAPKERHFVRQVRDQPDEELASTSVSDHARDNEDGVGKEWV